VYVVGVKRGVVLGTATVKTQGGVLEVEAEEGKVVLEGGVDIVGKGEYFQKQGEQK
jgi:diaminopimelate epimerase